MRPSWPGITPRAGSVVGGAPSQIAIDTRQSGPPLPHIGGEAEAALTTRNVRTGGCRRACCFGVAEVELFYAHRRWPRTEISRLGCFSLQEKTHLKNRTANATTNSVAPTA